MRVVSQSPERLVIEERPWFWGVFYIAFILSFSWAALQSALRAEFLGAALAASVAAGVTFLFLRYVERVWLVLDRAGGTAEFRRRGMRGLRREAYPLERVKSALAQRNSSGEGDTWRLVLLIEGASPVPMTPYYQSGKGTRRCVEAVEGWLAENRVAENRAGLDFLAPSA